MVLEIGRAERAEAVLREKLERGERLMLIRPESRYVGPRRRRYTPLDQR
jgi:citrate synthase